MLKELKKKGPGFGAGAPARRSINLSSEALIRIGHLREEGAIPVLIEPTVEGVSLAAWTTGNWHLLDEQLLKYGAVLFRGFKEKSIDDMERIIRASSLEPVAYNYGSTPRTQAGSIIYTSTEYPADQYIPLHNEMSYTSEWPMKLWFFCVTPATGGGETPLADSRKVFNRISRKTREKFADKGVSYVRNYGDGLDLSWEAVFRTTDKREVERFCRETGIEFEWKEGNRLRTRQVTQAIATHPKTGEAVWFNQAHLFHVSSLKTEVRESLLEGCEEKDLPRNSYYGDGSAIEPSVLDEIRDAYRQEEVRFPWQERDVLILENMLVAHGRAPFTGPRRILVGMADSSKGSSN